MGVGFDGSCECLRDGQRHLLDIDAIKGSADGIIDALPIGACGTEAFDVTAARPLFNAGSERDRSLDRRDHLGDGDVAAGAGQAIAALRTPLRGQYIGTGQHFQDLAHGGLRYKAVLRYVGSAELPIRPPRQIGHNDDAIVCKFAQPEHALCPIEERGLIQSYLESNVFIWASMSSEIPGKRRSFCGLCPILEIV